MRVLVIDCALPEAWVALVEDGAVLGEVGLGQAGTGRAQVSLLPGAVAGLFAAHGARLDRIVANVGPGSFTGLRASLALAHGLALGGASAEEPSGSLSGGGPELVGVTGGEALEGMLLARGSAAEGRAVWVATPARAGRVFLEQGGVVRAALLGSLPAAAGPVLVAGAAAVEVAAELAAAGVDVVASGLRRPDVAGLLAAAQRRVDGALPPREALPLYVDPPEASLPRAGLRPAPR